jgi:hypothetical protein
MCNENGEQIAPKCGPNKFCVTSVNSDLAEDRCLQMPLCGDGTGTVANGKMCYCGSDKSAPICGSTDVCDHQGPMNNDRCTTTTTSTTTVTSSSTSTDANGNTTTTTVSRGANGEVTQTTTKTVDAATGAITTVVKDADGNVVSTTIVNVCTNFNGLI